jgi:hypothetical protein
MAEDKKSIDGVIEKLALIVDGVESLFPDGKVAVAIELGLTDYKKVQNNFRTIDHHHKQFMIEISNTQFMFLLDESSNGVSGKTSETLSQIKSDTDISSAE